MDAMTANFNNPQPLMGLAENFSATYVSTGNPCLDFFFHIVPDTPAETLKQRLELAWQHNDLTSLKLICHLRGVRDTGKSDKEGFYTAALWLNKHHPKTLACNVQWMADFGYFKDLPEILYRILQGHEVRKIAKQEFQRRKKPRMPKPSFIRHNNQRGNQKGRRDFNFNQARNQISRTSKPRDAKRAIPREKTLAVEMKKVNINKEKARNLQEKGVAKARKAVERYARDPDFRFLHDQISQVFADRLISDMNSFNSGEFGKISLASKWCPSLDSAFDKATLLCESIAKTVFSREAYPRYEGIEEAHYAFRVRDRLRKEVLVPLREKLELPELYMSANNWDTLHYSRVPSVAMTKYKKHFLKHDETRFNEFLGKVEKGEAKIAAGALLPHEIIKELDNRYDGGQVSELQWKRMVEDLTTKNKLKNCIAVCDVFGSMVGTPMEVYVALGLLLSELSEQTWGGKVIVFHENPELHIITGYDLRSKTEFIRKMKWGCNTNFQRIFDLILQVALKGKLSKDQMTKKVFVFSDMEFDQVGGRRQRGYGWDTDYEVLQRKFAESGYDLPELVFWNLRESKSIPVTKDQKGVALVSGFSKNMMKLFLNEEELSMKVLRL